MRKLTLFIDLDEVTVNLSEAVRERVNKDFNKNYPKGFNQNYWWADYYDTNGINKRYFENLLNEKEFFLNLEPVEGSIKTLNKLNEEGFDIHILTLPQYSNGNCFISKVKCVQKYLPFINIETNFHTSGNKGLFASKNRLLLDDSVKNLNKWDENNGIAVAFNHGWNKDFKGHRVHNWNQFYNLVHLSNNKDDSFDIDKFRYYMRGSHNE